LLFLFGSLFVSFVAFKRKRQFLGKRFFSPPLLLSFNSSPCGEEKKGGKEEKKRKFGHPALRLKEIF
jgi:hypothetical protein